MFRKLLRPLVLFLWLGAGMSLTSCDKETNSVNIFSLEDDKQLGDQVEQEILSNPQQYHVLDRNQYTAAYGHLDRIVNSILNSGKVVHKNDFNWSVRIIRDDSTLNAFAAPGGKIFVYTGIIKFLNAEDEFAGVMGHEIAHADRRHVTDEMTKAYGIQLLLDIALGKNQGALSQVAVGLATLRFGRGAERDADDHGVIYLDATKNTGENYDPRGVGKFFQKLIDMGQSSQGPEFLSTHPDPGERVENINKKWQELGSTPGQTYADRYQQFKASLP